MQEPPDLIPAIDRLVARAVRTGVSTARVRVCARLLAYARLLAEGEEIGADHAYRSLRESVGELHGMRDGYANPEEAGRVYRSGRKARQAAHGSAHSARIAVLRLHEVLAKYRSDLPEHIRDAFPPEKIQTILETLNHLWHWTCPAEDHLKSRDAICRSDLSATRQTYIWWRFSVPAYRGKWNDMYALARAWHLTDANDVSGFRRYVLRICAGVSSTIPSPPWATV
jgi:cation transport regulator ChaB